MCYYQDIFYSVDRLSIEAKKQIINDALKVCYEWHVDILDCSKSWAREKIEMSINEILSKLEGDSHFVFIHRRGYPIDKGKIEKVGRTWLEEDKWCLEVGFRTMTSIDYFLWIHCEQEHIESLSSKYDLKPNMTD